MASKKKLRRHLKRIADRKDISYRDSICNFYGKKLDEINKSLLALKECIRALDQAGKRDHLPFR